MNQYKYKLALRHKMTFLEAIDRFGPLPTRDIGEVGGVRLGHDVCYALRELKRHSLIHQVFVPRKPGPSGWWATTERGKLALAIHRGKMMRRAYETRLSARNRRRLSDVRPGAGV